MKSETHTQKDTCEYATRAAEYIYIKKKVLLKNSLRNLIHWILRHLLKLLILMFKNQSNFTIH